MTQLLEWFPVNAAHTLSDQDLLGLSLAEIGLAWKLRLFCWKDGSVPADSRRLARLVGASIEEVNEGLEGVSHLLEGDPSDANRLIMPLVEAEREEQSGKHDRRVRAGSKGGAVKAASNATVLPSNATALPSNAEHCLTVPKQALATRLEKKREEKRRKEEEPPNPPEGGEDLAIVTRDAGSWTPPANAINELEDLAGGADRLRELVVEIRGSPGRKPAKRGALRWLKGRITEARGVQIPEELRTAIPTIEELWTERVANAESNGHRISIATQNTQLRDAASWLSDLGVDAVAEAIREARRGGYKALFKPKTCIRGAPPKKRRQPHTVAPGSSAKDRGINF